MIYREKYYITMDSFGVYAPDNWTEIADWLNDQIDEIINEFEWGIGVNGEFPYEMKCDMEYQIESLWDDYCLGRLPDAPKEVFEEEVI